jgi:hypothetical protein
MRKDSMRTRLAPAALCLLLGACSAGDGSSEGGGEALSAEDAAKADAMLARYEAARTAGNPEAAEAAADELRDRYPDSEDARKLEPTLEEVRKAAESVREQKRLRGLWDYQAIAAGGGTQRSASVFSRTADAGEDQPAPIPDAQLVLRDHPQWGRSAYLLLQASKFNCGKPCTLQLSFDGAAPETWAGKQADSGKGPALFIEDEARFIKALEAARQLRVTLPKDSGSIGSLVFEVGGFVPERYAKP